MRMSWENTIDLNQRSSHWRGVLIMVGVGSKCPTVRPRCQDSRVSVNPRAGICIILVSQDYEAPLVNTKSSMPHEMAR